MELTALLLKRFESLNNLRQLNFDERLEAMSFIEHRTKEASRTPSPVQSKILNTAVSKLAVDSFVNYFQGNLVSPNQPWLSIRYESSNLMRQDEMPGANEFVGRLQDAVSSELAVSNFYPEHRLSCKDEYVGAASAILIRNDPIRNVCVFETLAPWDYWIDVDQYGEMDTFFYKRNMNLAQAYEMFENKLPEEFIKILEEGNGYDTYYDFLLCYYPQKKIFTKSIFDEEKKYASVWMALTSTTGENSSGAAVIIDKSGADYIPVVFNCWDRDGDNPYGTCPVMRNIEEIKKADVLTYETFLSIQKINHQSWVGVAQSLENFSDDPGSRNYVQSMDLAPKPLEVNQTVDGAMQMQNEQYGVIQKTFNNDLFSYLSRQENSKVFTATQVNAIKAEQLALLSAVYGNFQKKIEKIIKIVVFLMAEHGRLPKGSENLVGKDINEKAGKLRVVIDSTLSQELKAYTKRDANIAFLEQVAVFKQLQLDAALMNVDMNELIRGIGFGIGVDHKVIRDLSVVQQEQQAQQQLALQQMQQQQALTESEINRNNAGAANLNNSTGNNQYQG